jgi:hypothetical protein
MTSLPKSPAEIPNGSLHEQFVRCGKPNCRCTRGEPHTAHYFLARMNGRQVKRYVRKADLQAFARIVQEATSLRKHRREELKKSKESLKTIRRILRETKINK